MPTLGRPTKYPAPTEKQIAIIIGPWHGDKKRAVVMASVGLVMGREVKPIGFAI
jgi:hypothetical protein